MTLNRRTFMKVGAAAPLAAGLTANPVLAETCQVAERQDLAGPIRLIANENPYGPSPKARQAMYDAFDEAHRYAIRPRMELEGLIAAQEQLAKGEVFITAGSGELLRMAGLWVAQQGKKVLAADPTFDMLQPYAERAGAEIVKVPLTADHVHDLDAMEAALTDEIGLIYICNPNNPTGTLLDPDDLRAFCTRVSPRALVLVDEAYTELTDNPQKNAMVDLVRSGANVLLTRTFSKLHGMAGLRVGYGLAPEDVVKNIKPLQMSFLNMIGLKAAIASYQDLAFQSFSRNKIIEGRQMVMEMCDELGLAYAPSSTNFVFFDSGIPASDLSSKLRERNILMRGVAGFDTKCRVSIGTVEQMAQFTDAVKEILEA